MYVVLLRSVRFHSIIRSKTAHGFYLWGRPEWPQVKHHPAGGRGRTWRSCSWQPPAWTGPSPASCPRPRRCLPPPSSALPCLRAAGQCARARTSSQRTKSRTQGARGSSVGPLLSRSTSYTMLSNFTACPKCYLASLPAARMAASRSFSPAGSALTLRSTLRSPPLLPLRMDANRSTYAHQRSAAVDSDFVRQLTRLAKTMFCRGSSEL